VSQIKVWQETQAQVRRDPIPWRVPGLLWAGCTSLGFREGALPERLKLKLMLRAFVEEIPDSPERKELLRLAYSCQGEGFQDLDPDEQALERVSLTYPQLHHQLSLGSLRVADWFNGALSPAGVADMAAPYADFDDWLFETEETPGENHVA